MKSQSLKAVLVWLGIIILGFTSLHQFNSCKKAESNITELNAIEVTKTGCKTEFLIYADSSNQDCINYRFNNNTLHIKHINAAFNCCPNKVYVIANISNDTIKITEKEVLSQPCKCNCLYDIEYNIQNVPDSSYVVIINEPYVSDQTEKIIFTTYPSISSTGDFCKTRNIYPWGL
jgi:hypothetical protein